MIFGVDRSTRFERYIIFRQLEKKNINFNRFQESIRYNISDKINETSYMRETKKNKLLVSEVGESRKRGLSTVFGLPSFISDDSFSQTTIIRYIFTQCEFTIDIIVYLLRINAQSNRRYQFINLIKIVSKEKIHQFSSTICS